MLTCSNLVKKYLACTAVHDFNTELKPGRIYALLGPNGSGKTTFMKMAAGLIKPTEGSITFQDQPIGVETKKHIAYMPTESYFYSYMTVKNIGGYYRDFFPDFDPEKYDRLIAQMELDANMKAAKMSSGMLAKLKLAVTLSRDSDLMMLDEPLNGIDIIAREQVLQAVHEADNGKRIIVMSSHLVDEMEPMITDAIFVKKGTIVLQGEAEWLRREHQKTIVDLYKGIYGRQSAEGELLSGHEKETSWTSSENAVPSGKSASVGSHPAYRFDPYTGKPLSPETGEKEEESC